MKKISAKEVDKLRKKGKKMTYISGMLNFINIDLYSNNVRN